MALLPWLGVLKPVSIHDFKINAVSKTFLSKSVNDSKVDDYHQNRVLFEAVRNRFE